MERDDAYFLDMLEAARKARSFISGVDRIAFERDEEKKLAVLRLIQIVGEAARGISDERRAQHPDIPWKQIVGMRHRLVHDYFNIDSLIVWKTLTEDLPPLIEALEIIVGE